MFGIAKKDMEAFLDLVKGIGSWALDGFDPIIPDLDEGFVNEAKKHADGVGSNFGTITLKMPKMNAETVVGKCDACDGSGCSKCSNFWNPDCESCGGKNYIDAGPIPDVASSYVKPCPECNDLLGDGMCKWCKRLTDNTLCNVCQSWAKPKYGPHHCWECGKDVPVFGKIDVEPRWVSGISSVTGGFEGYAILTQCDGCKAYSDYKSNCEQPLEGWARADDPLDAALRKNEARYVGTYGDLEGCDIDDQIDVRLRSYGVMKSRIEALEKENEHLHEVLNDMGKMFRKYRDTGSLL